MADEFAKGFGIFVTAGLGWMTLAGWYKTPSFESGQLISSPVLENPTVYDSIALFLMDGLFWFAILGPLAFWLVVPMIARGREAWAERTQ